MISKKDVGILIPLAMTSKKDVGILIPLAMISKKDVEGYFTSKVTHTLKPCLH